MLASPKQRAFSEQLSLHNRGYLCLSYEQLTHKVWPLKTNINTTGTLSYYKDLVIGKPLLDDAGIDREFDFLKQPKGFIRQLCKWVQLIHARDMRKDEVSPVAALFAEPFFYEQVERLLGHLKD